MRRWRHAVARWIRFKNSPEFHDAVLFLVFFCISTFFWYIKALNESSQENFTVRVALTNVPDSITFISDIPERIHVGVRDRGTNLFRTHFRHPSVNIDFREYGKGGVLSFPNSDLMTSLKSIFGSTAAITGVSIDSLRLDYTANKGKRVPVVVAAQVTAASGSTIEGNLKAIPSNVYVYGDSKVLDTIHSVKTEIIIRKDLSESASVDVALGRIKNARVIPSTVKVEIPVEPLVKKEAMITLTAVNVADGKSMLLFPSKVPVDYFVAMSRFGEDDDPEIELTVDYRETVGGNREKLPVVVSKVPDRIKNLSLKTDSVEFTIVRN